MMLIALLLAQTATPPPPPPSDWSRLPDFPAAIIVPAEAADYVRDQVRSGSCGAVPNVITDAPRSLTAPVAVLVGPAGAVRQVVPQAIHCRSVEQYTVGYILSATRRVAETTLPPLPGWYRLTLTYRW